MTMAQFSLLQKTRERLIEAHQTSTYKFTERESQVIETKALQMILNGNPPAILRASCKARLAEINAELAGYPRKLFAARRAEFIRRVMAKRMI